MRANVYVFSILIGCFLALAASVLYLFKVVDSKEQVAQANFEFFQEQLDTQSMRLALEADELVQLMYERSDAVEELKLQILEFKDFAISVCADTWIAGKDTVLSKKCDSMFESTVDCNGRSLRDIVLSEASDFPTSYEDSFNLFSCPH